MAIVPSGVSVPAQSKELDNNVVTTSYGTVYRQVVCLADPETQNYYQRVGSNGAYVDVRNVVSLPLPTDASTSALQTTGNASLSSVDTKLTTTNSTLATIDTDTGSISTSVSSIDTKTPALVTGRVPVDGSAVTQPISAASLPLPTDASTSALQTTGNASLTSIDTKLPSLDGGYVPVTIKNSSIEISNDAGNPVPVSGTFWQATQPVSAASLPLPTGAATESTLSALSAKFSALGQTTMAASVPVVLSSDHSDIPTKTKGDSFSNISTLGTTNVKSGAGILRRIVINTKGAGSNILTVYNNTAGSGTIIATIDTSDKISNIEYGLSFSVGLTIVNATGTSANVTVIYE